MEDIDIEHLSHEELVRLNRRIVERIKHLNKARNFMDMIHFDIGNRVQFESSDGRSIEGTVIRLNQKTVSVVTAEGDRWNVSPRLLSKVVKASERRSDENVIDINDLLA